MTRRLRNSLVVGTVLLVFGVAAADALRDVVPERDPRERERKTTTAPDTGTPGRFIGVDGARGSLVFTDPEDCRVREIAVGSATEYPLEPTKGNCRLWVPPFGARIAYGVGDAADGGVAFRFLDLNHPEEEFPVEFSYDGRIVWSPDGQRATWCENEDEGVDFEFYAERRLLDGCARGYLDTGQIVFVRGNRVLGGLWSPVKTLVAARRRVDEVAVGIDGSIGIVAGGRFERYARGRMTHSRAVPRLPIAGRPNFSPDNCAVLFRAPGEVHLVDLGCLGRSDTAWRAKDAAWSPDGRWVAVSVTEGILFHNVFTAGPNVAWRRNAAELGWRGHVRPTDG